MAAAFTTLIWPLSASTFDNAQHAFFALLGVYLGFLSAQRASRRLAIAAGVTTGALLLYQEYFILIIPALAFVTIDMSSGVGGAHKRRTGRHAIRLAISQPGAARESCVRYLCFTGAVGVAVVLMLLYNHIRFDAWLDSGKLHHSPQGAYPLFGNPVIGALTLLVSPGKSIFLYSPPLIIGVLGMVRLWRREPALAIAVTAASAILVSFISCISFAGGDWCWGPRYLVVLLPLWAVPAPFFHFQTLPRRIVVTTIMGLGLCVQLLGVSVETHRFFQARGFKDFVWAEDPWFYFKHSALLARPGEALSLVHGVPDTARWFNTLATPGLVTYVILGPPSDLPREQAPVWMRQYAIYYLPRPWPFWIVWLDRGQRPVNPLTWMGVAAFLTILGFLLMSRGLRTAECSGDRAVGAGGTSMNP
jgi:hypothetical protein